MGAADAAPRHQPATTLRGVREVSVCPLLLPLPFALFLWAWILARPCQLVGRSRAVPRQSRTRQPKLMDPSLGAVTRGSSAAVQPGATSVLQGQFPSEDLFANSPSRRHDGAGACAAARAAALSADGPPHLAQQAVHLAEQGVERAAVGPCCRTRSCWEAVQEAAAVAVRGRVGRGPPALPAGAGAELPMPAGGRPGVAADVNAAGLAGNAGEILNAQGEQGGSIVQRRTAGPTPAAAGPCSSRLRPPAGAGAWPGTAAERAAGAAGAAGPRGKGRGARPLRLGAGRAGSAFHSRFAAC